MIEVRHLRLIEAVAKVGSLKKAADQLFLSQSALSHQLKELESQLGTQIFHRINNQLHFTQAGKEFRDAGRDILNQLGQLEDRVQQMNRDNLTPYIHGYSDQEAQRLNNQAKTIAELLHWDSVWEEGATILEVGCGVGAQTRIIASKNPKSNFVSFDLSEKSLTKAAETISDLKIKNVEFRKADVFNLPFENETFDHVFLSFVLEHISKPEEALLELKRVLKKQGMITVIEGDHGSAYFYPDSDFTQKAIQAQITLQNKNGGNANIGRQLFPLLSDAGFSRTSVSPRMVYVDGSKPEMIDGFIKKTFTAMIKGMSDEALSQKIISKEDMKNGIRDLYKTTEKGGVFCYTFFKATAYLNK